MCFGWWYWDPEKQFKMFKLRLWPHLLNSIAEQLGKKKLERQWKFSLDVYDLFVYCLPDPYPAVPVNIFIKPGPSPCASHYFNFLLHPSVWLLQARWAGCNYIVRGCEKLAYVFWNSLLAVTQQQQSQGSWWIYNASNWRCLLASWFWRWGNCNGVRHSDLPSPVTQWAVTFAEQGLNLWSPTCFSHPWSLKVVIAVPLRTVAPGPAAASGRSQLAAVEGNLQVLDPVTVFHWWLEKCQTWCAQPTEGGGSLRLNLGSWTSSLQVSKWRQFGWGFSLVNADDVW